LAYHGDGLGDAGGHLDQHQRAEIMIGEKGAGLIKGAARQQMAA
jgi:hypothetical protein